MKFVWLDVPGGGQIPVNPDQVMYLRQGQAEDDGKTEIVFDAGPYGLHTVIVSGDGRDVAKQLEDAPAGAPASPEPQRSKTKAARP